MKDDANDVLLAGNIFLLVLVIFQLLSLTDNQFKCLVFAYSLRSRRES